MKNAEKSFEVSVNNNLGVDPADQAEADVAFMMDQSRRKPPPLTVRPVTSTG